MGFGMFYTSNRLEYAFVMNIITYSKNKFKHL
jgi:hypothetical protein